MGLARRDPHGPVAANREAPDMGFVHAAKTDLFVSYAHVDDLPLESGIPGWVTTLVTSLKNLLAQRLGRGESLSLWMDHQLPGHVELTPEIEGKLGEAAVLLIVLSPAYLASTWCLKEMRLFIEAILRGGGRVGARIFVVEYDQVERPPDLGDLKGFRFWAKGPLGRSTRTLGIPRPGPDDRGYFDQLYDLRHDLAEALTRLKVVAEDVSMPDGVGDRPVVFLAEVTDDLDDHREEVRRLPAPGGPGRRAGGHLSPRHGRLPRGGRGRPVPRQALRPAPERARRQAAAGRIADHRRPPARVRRRSRRLRPPVARPGPRPRGSRPPRPPHRLEGPSVIVADIQEFKGLVVQKVRELSAPKPAAPTAVRDADTLVFVNAEEGDLDLAKRIGGQLFRRGVGYVLPNRSRQPAEARKALEKYLLNCDGLVLVHGTNPDWVLEQVMRFRKIKPRRESPIKAIGLCDGPPPDKQELHFGLPDLRVIDCRHGLDEEELNQFANHFIR